MLATRRRRSIFLLLMGNRLSSPNTVQSFGVVLWLLAVGMIRGNANTHR